ncbi:PAAR motif protein [Novipirellula galeiformis]|uniref:PAAR motif protein n=1 Tax=Novipirellula galeiformis TaxID=2528004 RepID=A0A5C6CIE6_9BACT|nr:PAAR domain-containing protein [Novipirellula galeiformis]TWU23447.1 PAAR motif protein [Novipirellula galeiformis]
MGLPAARATDMQVCPAVTAIVPHVGGPIAMGCPTVLIGNLPAARMGDPTVCVGPPGTVTGGSPMVLIGGKPAARLTDAAGHGGVISAPGCPTVLIG